MRPLEGIRVLDLTRVLSGPYCTMLLGDLGAEVIKVERPGEGDDTRAFAPPFQGDQAAYFPAMERLGFGYEAVRARHPAMIYCSISGFGDSGPQKNRAGYDVIVQGEAGIMDLTGPRDGPPHKVGTSIADLVSGLVAAQGILAALYAAKIDGRGQQVHVSMYEAVAALLTFNASIYFATGNSPRRRGNEHATIVPYETFEASDGWINLGVANDDIWRRFCAAAGVAELADDPRFATAPDRVQNRDALIPMMKALFKERSRNEWLKKLDDSGVPCGAIRTVAEVCDSEVLRARNMVAEMSHASAGTVKGIKSAIHLSENALNTYNAPPTLGQHTHEVLTALLGYTSDEVHFLTCEGVV